MKIHIVAATLPPELDGIGDYTAHLAVELERSGTVTVLTSTANPKSIPGVCIRTVFSPEVRRSVYNIAAQVEQDQPDWVVLQFNQFSFGKWGLNPYLPLAMRQIKKRCPKTRFAWMAHEDFVPVISWKFAVMTTWQRWQFRALGQAADVIFFSIDPWVQQYQSWFPNKPIVHLPVGSNIPRVEISRSEARERLGIAEDTLVLGLFGTAHSSRLLGLIRDAVEAAYKQNPNVLALYIGPHGEAVRAALQGLPVLAEGPFPAEEVSRRFAAMDIYLVPIVGGVSTRRGSFMTALQHGIPTVSTFGTQTDKMLLAQNNRAFVLTNVDSSVAFADAVINLVRSDDRGKALSSQGVEMYQREFDWCRIADRLLATLNEKQEAT